MELCTDCSIFPCDLFDGNFIWIWVRQIGKMIIILNIIFNKKYLTLINFLDAFLQFLLSTAEIKI